MKYFSKFLFFALISSLFVFQSCDEDVVEVELKNVTQTAVSDADLSILVSALTKANLASTLEGDGPFTVFAPTDAAFQALLDSNDDWDELDDIPAATLEAVLLYHVVSGTVKSTDLTNGYVPTLSNGPGDTKVKALVDITSGVKINGSSTVTSADILATNGVIHKINSVLLPPNVVGVASNNSIFTSLVAALTRDGNTYTNLLSGDGPFTVFAPTNAAFDALLASNDEWSTLADIPSETLDLVLQYHVVDGANVLAGDLTDEMSVETYGGSTFTIDLDDGAQIKTATQTVDIVLTDVQGTNGVVHVVNEVLLP